MAIYKIALIKGDGIGPEIVAQAKRVLETIAKRFGHSFEMPERRTSSSPSTVPLPKLAPPRSLPTVTEVVWLDR